MIASPSLLPTSRRAGDAPDEMQRSRRRSKTIEQTIISTTHDFNRLPCENMGFSGRSSRTNSDSRLDDDEFGSGSLLHIFLLLMFFHSPCGPPCGRARGASRIDPPRRPHLGARWTRGVAESPSASAPASMNEIGANYCLLTLFNKSIVGLGHRARPERDGRHRRRVDGRVAGGRRGSSGESGARAEGEGGWTRGRRGLRLRRVGRPRVGAVTIVDDPAISV